MKKLILTITIAIASGIAVIAQPSNGTSAEGQSGYYNRNRNTQKDPADTSGPRGFDPKANGARVLKGDSAENAGKQTRKEAGQTNKNQNRPNNQGGNGSRRSSASNSKE